LPIKFMVAESGTATTLWWRKQCVGKWHRCGNDTTAVLFPGLVMNLTFNGNGTFSYVHNGSELPPIVLPINQWRNTDSNTVSVTINRWSSKRCPNSAAADQIMAAESGTATTLVGDASSAGKWHRCGNDTLRRIGFRVSNGTLTFNGNGTFSYVHNGSETTDSFTYKTNDGNNTDSNIKLA
jgi:hypothetical protein